MIWIFLILYRSCVKITQGGVCKNYIGVVEKLHRGVWNFYTGGYGKIPQGGV